MQPKTQLFTILLMIPLALMLVSCAGDQAESKSIEQLHQENGIPVHVQTIQETQHTSSLAYNAVLSGIKESNASAMVGDRIETIHKHVGDFVNKNEIVISLPTDNPAAQYMQAKVANEHAQTTLKRMENLYASGGIPLQELDNVRTQTKVTEANWQAVKQSIKIKAPISGTITQMSVSESENVAPGDVLFKVSDTRQLKAHLYVNESVIQTLKVGDEANALWNQIKLNGKVVQIDRALNNEQQAFGVRVEFENPEEKVMSGINAEIRLISKSDEAGIWIERKNLVDHEAGKAVYIVKNGAAQLIPVQIGRTSDLDVEITNGLNESDILIASSQPLLEDGAKINIIE